jgi:hypothetical protein
VAAVSDVGHLIVHLLFAAALALRVYGWTEADDSFRVTSVDILAALTVVSGIRVLALLGSIRQIGLLFIVVGQILKSDIVVWLTMAFFVVGPLLATFTSVFVLNNNSLQDTQFSGLLWAVFGMDFALPVNVEEVEVPGSEFLVTLADLFLVLFFLVVLILVNLLIATMAQTFERLSTKAEQELLFERVPLTWRFLYASALPPPLNLVELVVKDVVRCIYGSGRGSTRCCTDVYDEDASSVLLSPLFLVLRACTGCARCCRNTSLIPGCNTDDCGSRDLPCGTFSCHCCLNDRHQDDIAAELSASLTAAASTQHGGSPVGRQASASNSVSGTAAIQGERGVWDLVDLHMVASMGKSSILCRTWEEDLLEDGVCGSCCWQDPGASLTGRAATVHAKPLSCCLVHCCASPGAITCSRPADGAGDAPAGCNALCPQRHWTRVHVRYAEPTAPLLPEEQRHVNWLRQRALRAVRTAQEKLERRRLQGQ